MMCCRYLMFVVIFYKSLIHCWTPVLLLLLLWVIFLFTVWTRKSIIRKLAYGSFTMVRSHSALYERKLSCRYLCSATDSGFPDENWKQRGTENLLRKLWETGLLIVLWEVADHTRHAAVTIFLLWKKRLRVRKVNCAHICLPEKCTMPQNNSDNCIAYYSWRPVTRMSEEKAGTGINGSQPYEMRCLIILR